MRKFYLPALLPILIVFIPACSHTLPITERPCNQNITVLREINLNTVYLISTTIPVSEKDGSEGGDLSLYFQEKDNKHLLSFIYSSFGNTSPDSPRATLEFYDSTVIKLENPELNKEMNENLSDKYTDTFFEINDSNLTDLSQKDLKKITISFPPDGQLRDITTEPDSEIVSTIKYLANCFAETVRDSLIK